MTEKEKVVKEEKELNLAEKLGVIQSDLKAPKGQFNSFGKYKYRSCEDILEAVKPLLKKYRVVLTIADDIVLIGERYYIKATVTINDSSGNFKVSAYARESLDKKGMDDSQITGAASSYARKYALNGLLLIDDTKDADTDEPGMGGVKPPNPKPVKSEVKKVTGEQKAEIYNYLSALGIENIATLPKDPDYDKITSYLLKQKINSVEDLDSETAKLLIQRLNKKHEEKLNNESE